MKQRLTFRVVYPNVSRIYFSIPTSAIVTLSFKLIVDVRCRTLKLVNLNNFAMSPCRIQERLNLRKKKRYLSEDILLLSKFPLIVWFQHEDFKFEIFFYIFVYELITFLKDTTIFFRICVITIPCHSSTFSILRIGKHFVKRPLACVYFIYLGKMRN